MYFVHFHSSNTDRENEQFLNINLQSSLCLHPRQHSVAAKFFNFLYNTVYCLCLDTVEILRKHWLTSRGSGFIMSHPACRRSALFQNSQRTEIKGRNRNITPSCTSVSFWKIRVFNVKPTVRNIFCIHSSRVDHYPGWRGRVVLKMTKLFYHLYLCEGYVRLKLMRWSDQACSLKRLNGQEKPNRRPGSPHPPTPVSLLDGLQSV